MIEKYDNGEQNDIENEPTELAFDSLEENNFNENVDEEEDLFVPFGNQEFKPQENLNIDKDFNAVLDNVEETSDEVNVELPKIESATEEIEDEDIWKF